MARRSSPPESVDSGSSLVGSSACGSAAGSGAASVVDAADALSVPLSVSQESPRDWTSADGAGVACGGSAVSVSWGD